MTISVIVPVYNVEKYIRKCVDSITSQTYEDLEILLINDGSTDSSGDICKELASEDSRIKVIEQTNGGASKARNTGLDIATGEYIGFVDADDYIEKDMYEVMLREAKAQGAGIVSCGHVMEYVSGDKATFFDKDETVMLGREEAFRSMCLKRHIDISCCTKLFLRSVIAEKRYKVGIHTEDLQFLYRVMADTKKIVSINKALYHIFCRENSSSRKSDNPHVLDPLFTTKGLQDYIYETYPNLLPEVDNFYLMWHIDVYKSLSSSVMRSKYKKDRMKLRKELYHDRKKYYANKYIDKTYKFLLLGIGLGCFDFFDFALTQWFRVKK